MTSSADRTGILIVHLWQEPGSRVGLRARITQSMDSMRPELAMATAANAEDIYALVRTWVEDFVTLSSPDLP